MPNPVDLIATSHLAPLLRTHGFRKDGRTCRLSNDNVVRVVNLQGSRYNIGGEGEVTVNLGVLHPSAERVLRADGWAVPPPDPSRVKAFECTVKARIGHLMPQRSDTWWPLGRRTKKSGRKIATAVQTYGLPWLQLCSDPLEAARWLESTNYAFHGPIRALALLLTVDAQAAQAALDRWTAGAEESEAEEKVRIWARRADLRC